MNYVIAKLCWVILASESLVLQRIFAFLQNISNDIEGRNDRNIQVVTLKIDVEYKHNMTNFRATREYVGSVHTIFEN